MIKMSRNETLKLIIALKITLLASFILHYNGIVSFGEKDIAASVKNKPTKDLTINSPKEQKQLSSVKKSQNKSILDKILDLPKLDKSIHQKEELGIYFDLAEKKKREVTERIKILTKRKEDLKSIEKSITAKLKKLEEERAFFLQTIQDEKTLKGKRIDTLVSIYSKMEPKKAAPIFEKLNKDLTVAILNAIPKKQVKKIFEVMAPEKSVTLSEYYGRVGSGREYELLKIVNKSLIKEFNNKCR